MEIRRRGMEYARRWGVDDTRPDNVEPDGDDIEPKFRVGSRSLDLTTCTWFPLTSFEF
jgi:hypothetical protein